MNSMANFYYMDTDKISIMKMIHYSKKTLLKQAITI